MTLEGQQFGQYYCMQLLRRGGMAEVYLADDLKLRRQVAIKVIWIDPSHYSDIDEAKEVARLFLREARVIAQLDYVHILSLYDWGEKESNGITCMYIVMPLRPEGSLASWLHERSNAGVLLPRDVEHIVKQAASALQYAHDRKIIHQDVKPSNFLLYGEAERAEQLNLQLADFGVAKLMTTTSESENIRGTPIYMAPEHWEGRAVPASDQYALAVMAYELLTGCPPFEGENHHQLWYQHYHTQPQPPSAINPDIPDELDAVLLHALEKSPRDRFRSVSAFANAFRQALIDSGNIHQTLSITPLEARRGTRRVLILPGGRRVRVSVPAGAYQGQTIRLEGLGKQTVYGGPVGTLIITVAISQKEGSVSLSAPPSGRRADLAFNHNGNGARNSGPQDFPKSRVFLAITLVLLLMAVSGGLFYWTRATPRPVLNVSSSRTADTTTQSNLPATASARAASATASGAAATASATAVTATTIAANAAATATASSAAATATVTAYQLKVAVGKRALNDPLQGNNQSHPWDDKLFPDGSGCTFIGKEYHDMLPGKAAISPCFAQATDFSNFSYQIQIRLVKGDQGGIIFRADSDTETFYCFYIDGIGGYGLEIYKNATLSDTLSAGPDSSVHTGPNQSNLIAVVANGDMLDLYINMKHIATVKDSAYDHGEIGIFAQSTGDPTDVVFSDAQVWSR